MKLANRQAVYLSSLPLIRTSCSTGMPAFRGLTAAAALSLQEREPGVQKKTATEEPQRPTRKAGRHLRVPVLPDEEAQIKQLAASTGLSVASYLRNVGLGYQVRGILDNKRIEELARINGDLGRLGGLLKLWLVDDVRTRNFGGATLLAVLSKIEDTQDRMHAVMKEVVTPRVKR